MKHPSWLHSLLMMNSLFWLIMLTLPVFARSPGVANAHDFESPVEATTHLPVPEPTTLVLVITGFGILGYYRWQRQRLHGGLLPQATFFQIPFHQQSFQKERLMLIGEMTSVMIHDIKNILTGVKTCAEVLAMDDLSDEEQKDFAQLILQEVTRALNMSQEVLDFSHGREKNLNIQTTSVENLIHESLSPLKEIMSNQQIEVRTELVYRGNMYIDIEKMKRVCMNILRNAIEAMPEGGTLLITSQCIHNAIHLVFQDTGCGMSQELQSRIFDPFVTEGKSTGTGLGMSIVKTILDAHDAKINIESKIGAGTTMHILIPCSLDTEFRTGAPRWR